MVLIPLLFQERTPPEEAGPDLKAEAGKSATSQPETSSAPDNSMATHAGSLSGGQDNPDPPHPDQDGTETKKKSKKCCVIL